MSCNIEKKESRHLFPRAILYWLLMIAICGSTTTAQDQRDSDRPDQRQPGQGNRGQRGGEQRGAGGSRLGGYEKPPPANNIPDHPCDIILGRPTDRSIELRILQSTNGRGHVRYQIEGEDHWMETMPFELTVGQPASVVLESLQPNTAYRYQWIFVDGQSGETSQQEVAGFHTQRSPGSSFVFSVTSDSHLDENSSGDVYLQTIRNALVDRPDFHLELGDTFMTGKYVRPELSKGQYLAQRYYLSHLCSSSPLYFVIGNHDGESAGRQSMTWATQTRKSLFPNPSPNHFYSGNQSEEADIGHPENYYAWHWGDAQFITLDPYRYTTSRRRGQGAGGQGAGGGQRGRNAPDRQQGDGGQENRPQRDDTATSADGNWYWTLGEQQYRWLKEELAKPAKYRFVFIHHLVGGAVQSQRGGAEVATLWEWGGRDPQGEWQFDRYRPQWDKPIHQMLVDAGTSVVFHGHDHFFAKQDLDGIVYQEVPQPSHARSGNTRNAEEYGYLAGEFQPSSGFIRVRVAPEGARIDYVRTYLNGKEPSDRNGEVSFSYAVSPIPPK
jgi:predicted phosphodiesterase